eukprot:625158-Pleurochrysis_carterae.AAC.1
MSSPAPAQQILTGGQAGLALAALSRAVEMAGRSHDARPVVARSTQPIPVDFTSLSLKGWKSKGALSLFKLKDGRI